MAKHEEPTVGYIQLTELLKQYFTDLGVDDYVNYPLDERRKLLDSLIRSKSLTVDILNTTVRPYHRITPELDTFLKNQERHTTLEKFFLVGQIGIQDCIDNPISSFDHIAKKTFSLMNAKKILTNVERAKRTYYEFGSLIYPRFSIYQEWLHREARALQSPSELGRSTSHSQVSYEIQESPIFSKYSISGISDHSITANVHIDNDRYALTFDSSEESYSIYVYRDSDLTIPTSHSFTLATGDVILLSSKNVEQYLGKDILLLLLKTQTTNNLSLQHTSEMLTFVTQNKANNIDCTSLLLRVPKNSSL